MIKPIEGTEILFQENGVWFNMNSNGDVVPTHTAQYIKRYRLRNSMVVVKGDDSDFISNLNGDYITVVTDKSKIGKPDLLTFEFTKEWMSLGDFLKLRKLTDAFCVMAKQFNVPEKE
jgi:hypothetical protein